jgi:hypothetical protein
MVGFKRTIERRRTPRISVDFRVTLTCGDKQYRWQAREFSESGVFLAGDETELVGKNVEVVLALNAAASTVSLKGIVAYATDSGVAVRFRNPSADQRAVFRNFIEAHGTPA